MDPHIQSILDEYRRDLPLFQEAAGTITSEIRSTLSNAGIVVAAVESRVKAYDSLAGKLELKGHKYRSLADITDILRESL